MESLNGREGDAVGIHRGDMPFILADRERCSEILGDRADVADGSPLRRVVPGLNWERRHPFENLAGLYDGEVLLCITIAQG